MSEDGSTEIAMGILLSLIGFASIFVPGSPVYCCGFAVAGPILFLVGLSKAIRGPSRPAYPLGGYAYPPYAAPPYAPPPYAGPQPPLPSGAPPPAPGPASKTCSACARAVPENARFCPACGTPFG